jgi:ATP-binding cassette subfamily C (CFTR/MRP) protein 1
VTHQLQYVSSCDQVLYLEAGKVTEQGTYQQLMAAKRNFFTLMSTYVGEEAEEDDQSEDQEGQVERREESKSDSEEAPGAAAAAATTGSTAAQSKRAKTKARGLKTARKSSAGSNAGTTKKPKDITVLTSEQKKKAAVAQKAAEQLMQAEERTKGGVPLDVYAYYAKHCGGWFMVSITFVLMGCQTATGAWVTWWLSLWSDDEYKQSSTWYLGIYAALGIGQCIFAGLGTMFSAYQGVQAALELHNRSFQSVMRAPMSFFDTTPIGRIINRFSRDQDVIDSLLMDTLRMIVFMAMAVLSTFIMILIVTPWFGIPLVPVLVVYWYVQRNYRWTSRELKRLESISRSPLYAHFSGKHPEQQRTREQKQRMRMDADVLLLSLVLCFVCLRNPHRSGDDPRLPR